MAADKNVITVPSEHPKIKIHKWRVREGFPVRMSQVILLYEICDSDDKEIKKLKASTVGVVKKRLFKDGAIAETGYDGLGKTNYAKIIENIKLLS